MLLKLLNIKKDNYIFVTGAGGKTTFICRLADELENAGKKYLISTTTKMFPVQPYRIIGAGTDSQGKIKGLTIKSLDTLRLNSPGSAILVESDGSKGISLKWPADNEPVVSDKLTLHILILGLDVLGSELNERTFFRHHLYPFNEKKITPQTYINVAEHYINRISAPSTFIILNKLSCLDKDQAGKILSVIESFPVNTVLAGDIKGKLFKPAVLK